MYWQMLKYTLKGSIGLALALSLGLGLASCNFSQFVETSVPPAFSQLAEDGNVYSLVATDQGTMALRNAAQTLGYVAGPDIVLDGLDMIMIEFDLPKGVSGLDAIDALESAAPAATVGVNHAHRLQVPEQKAEGKRYANELLNWPQAGCKAVVAVGIIDGGISPTASVRQHTKVIDRQFGAPSAAALRHGTEVATVLADPSRISSMTLYSASVITSDAEGNDAAGSANLVQALNWMAIEGVKIVNMSLTGPRNKLVKRAIDSSASKGMILVAPAGNQGKNAPPQFPAALDNVIAVTAVDANKRIYRNAVQGSYVDIAAPGVDVFVPSENGGRYVSGTSIAAPFVTSSLATRSGSDFGALVGTTVDLGQSGKDNAFGSGLLQLDGVCVNSM